MASLSAGDQGVAVEGREKQIENHEERRGIGFLDFIFKANGSNQAG